MHRRQFFKLAAAAGLAVVPATRSRRLFGMTGGPPKSLFVTVHAAGGWDATMLCDPKGRNGAGDLDPINRGYERSDIRQVGNIPYAPSDANEAFFSRFHRELLVINGIDVQTNGHETGTRHAWSGGLTGQMPSLPALVAAHNGAALPMAYMTFGGYDVTGGVIARTRSGNLRVLERLTDPSSTPSGSRYHDVGVDPLIAQAQAERDRSLLSRVHLSRRKTAMSLMYAAREGMDGLRLLNEYLPEELDRSSNPLLRQAQVITAAYRAGLCASANMSMGGFDTHSNHDNAHQVFLSRLLEGVTYLFDEAEAYGIRDELVVVIGSEFGRLPSYNSDHGKDHWPVTSAMLIGRGVEGDRVIGATDDELRALPVDPATLQPDPEGVTLEPGHVHRALRDLAGISGTALDEAFPLPSVGLQADLLSV